MNTHELFKKHFGNQIAVDLKHPNMESFFEELNEECLQEDKHMTILTYLFVEKNGGAVLTVSARNEEEAFEEFHRIVKHPDWWRFEGSTGEL